MHSDQPNQLQKVQVFSFDPFNSKSSQVVISNKLDVADETNKSQSLL